LARSLRVGKGEVVVSASVYVVRHAHAHPRDTWTGPDRDRTLTERGAKEASALVGRFAAPPGGAPPHKHGPRAARQTPTLLMSSRAERCLASLQPLSVAFGLPIMIAEFLSEGTDVDSFYVHLKELATAGGVPVLCTHGDVIWSLVDLFLAAGTPMTGPVEVRKGSMLVLETEAGSVQSVRYIPPAKV